MATNNANNFSNPIGVSTGGTGIASTVAYSPLIGGTTSTGPLQSVAGISSTGTVLTSNGSGVAPTFSGTNTNHLVLISQKTASASASINFTSGITSTYSTYMLLINKGESSAGNTLQCTLSTNGGSSYVTTGYLSGYNDWLFVLNSITNTHITTSFYIGVLSASSAKYTCGRIYFFNMTNGSNVYINGEMDSAEGRFVTGGSSGTANVNAISLSMISGTITAGTFSLYGILE
jgi:hypothetical protein